MNTDRCSNVKKIMHVEVKNGKACLEYQEIGLSYIAIHGQIYIPFELIDDAIEKLKAFKS